MFTVTGPAGTDNVVAGRGNKLPTRGQDCRRQADVADRSNTGLPTASATGFDYRDQHRAAARHAARVVRVESRRAGGAAPCASSPRAEMPSHY
jgi:hypothetical protein